MNILLIPKLATESAKVMKKLAIILPGMDIVCSKKIMLKFNLAKLRLAAAKEKKAPLANEITVTIMRNLMNRTFQLDFMLNVINLWKIKVKISANIKPTQ